MTNNALLDKEINTIKDDLSIDKLDMSFGEIISMYERNEIIINRNAQRSFKWESEQQSQFIESLLLGIPIPPIFVAEISEGSDAGKWELVDGLQRVSTVLSFFGKLTTIPKKNNLILSEAGLVKHILKGYASRTLPLKYQLSIRRSVCRIEIIKWHGQVDLRHELLKRYEELKQTTDKVVKSSAKAKSIAKQATLSQAQQFNNFIEEMAKLSGFESLVSPAAKRKSKAYLQEVVLRFFALYDVVKSDTTVKKTIRGNITSYTASYLKAVNEGADFDYESSRDLFKQLIKLLSPLGKGIFRGGNEGRGTFAPNVYDIVMLGIALNMGHYESYSAQRLLNKIKSVKLGDEFEIVKGLSANTGPKITQRIEFAKKSFTP